MSKIIDFDNPISFPQSLCTWDERFEQEILRRVSLKGVSEWWQIEQQLQDMHITIRKSYQTIFKITWSTKQPYVTAHEC